MPFYSTLIPLLGVLGVTAVKDAYDDVVSYTLPAFGVLLCLLPSFCLPSPSLSLTCIHVFDIIFYSTCTHVHVHVYEM